MKNWIKIFALTAFSTQMYAQKNLTIDEAVSYALENNVNVKKAKIDQTIAQQKVKETVGIGLPQVNGQVRYLNGENQVQLVDVSNFNNTFPKGTIVPLNFGLPHNFNAGLSVTQLLFNGSYIVGLESAKTYKETASLIKEKTDVSIKEAVMMMYAGILATEENIKTLEENKKVLEKNLNDTKQVYKTGLTELQSVEQLEYSYKNLSTVIDNLKRTKDKLNVGLKYLIGYPLEEKLVLSSSFDEVLDKNKQLIARDSFDFSNHVDLKLKQNQVRINQLLLKLEKSKALPSLAAFFNPSYVSGGYDFKPFSSDWFYSSNFGIQIDIPVFSGLQRHWKTEQAKLNLVKAQLDKEDAEKQLQSEYYQKATDYENALASYNTAEDLVKLSSEIYRKQNVKFKEGLGTSFELSQAENQLYEAQTKYYQAAIELIQAKVQLDKAKGIL